MLSDKNMTGLFAITTINNKKIGYSRKFLS